MSKIDYFLKEKVEKDVKKKQIDINADHHHCIEHVMTSNLKACIDGLKKKPMLRTDHDLNHILPYTKNISLFADKDSHVTQDNLKAICERMFYEKFNAGDTLF